MKSGGGIIRLCPEIKTGRVKLWCRDIRMSLPVPGTVKFEMDAEPSLAAMQWFYDHEHLWREMDYEASLRGPRGNEFARFSGKIGITVVSRLESDALLPASDFTMAGSVSNVSHLSRLSTYASAKKVGIALSTIYRATKRQKAKAGK